MQFVVARSVLQKELAFVQGVVERKNTIPVLANILIESAGEDSIRISGTDLDVTIRCDADAQEISAQGAMCVQARKLSRNFLRVSITSYRDIRSEEHTSELQSRVDLVCRLLLEKKKKKTST